MPLSDAAVRALKPSAGARKVSDAGGLYVYLTPGGSKLWRWKYRYGGREKTMAFGAYPAVSLSEARRRRDAAKVLLAAGLDPSVEAKLAKIRQAEGAANTFSAIADELLVKDEKEGRAPATIAKKRWLLDMARADIGTRPVAQVTPAEVLACLRKVERAGNYETARRMRGQIGAVFRFAIATARAETDPTLALRGALTTPTVAHRAAILDRVEFGGLLRGVWSYEGQPETKAALQLLAYLFPRPGDQADHRERGLLRRPLSGAGNPRGFGAERRGERGGGQPPRRA